MVSLDDFTADKNGELDFVTSPEFNKASDHDVLSFMDSIDTIILGANTYRLFADFWPTATTDTEIISDKINYLAAELTRYTEQIFQIAAELRGINLKD